MGKFQGFSTQSISSSTIELEYLETGGPRITSLKFKGSTNLFADISRSVPTPWGDFHFMGGHRLWHSPESKPRTYVPDEDGLTVEKLTDGLLLKGKVEPGTGIRKSIEIHLEKESSTVKLTHFLTNEGLWDVALAPWALTMFRLGGTAILPIQPTDSDPASLLPDRHISLWPYSHLDDPRLHWGDDLVLLKAVAGSPPFKIGMFNPVGWMAYYIDGILFQKTFDSNQNRLYPDFGCNAESYSGDEFIELESLGPIQRIAPGCSISHQETWEVFDDLRKASIPEKYHHLLK